MEKSGLIKARFAELGISQKTAAERLGTTQQLVNAYINGGRKFGAQMAKKWSEEFGFSIDWLLTGEGYFLKNQQGTNLTFGDINVNQGVDRSVNKNNHGQIDGGDSELKTTIAVLENEIKHLQEMLSEKDARLAEKEATIKEKERTIGILMKTN